MDAKDLGSVPLFAGLSAKDREQIARWADAIDLPAGYELLREGRFAYEFFIVLDGNVVVTKAGQALATLGPGDFFGEIALLEEERRTATVEASTPVRVAVMTTREFNAMCAQMGLVAQRIEDAMRDRMQR